MCFLYDEHKEELICAPAACRGGGTRTRKGGREVGDIGPKAVTVRQDEKKRDNSH